MYRHKRSLAEHVVSPGQIISRRLTLIPDPSRDFVWIEVFAVSPLFYCLPYIAPACQHWPLGFGPDDSKPPLPMSDESVHQTLLYQRRHHHLNVCWRHIRVSPYHAFIGSQLSRPTGRWDKCRGIAAVVGAGSLPSFQTVLEIDGCGVKV